MGLGPSRKVSTIQPPTTTLTNTEADEASNASLNVVNVNSRFVISAVADRPQTTTTTTLNVDPRPTQLSLEGQGE